MNKEKIYQKWGFGMAPLKSSSLYKNKKAIYTIYKILNEEQIDHTGIMDEISIFKGLINRCIRQDQWDWFTIYAMFYYPDINYLKKIVPKIIELRKAIKDNNKSELNKIISYLNKYNTKELCIEYLNYGNIDNHLTVQYIYILSIREESEILKIGETTRTVEKRIKEINSATGVLRPYSARGVFKVKNSKLAEKRIFERLKEYRIRNDREFFNIDYNKAKYIIDDVLKGNDLYINEY